jgi:hypothetical protein
LRSPPIANAKKPTPDSLRRRLREHRAAALHGGRSQPERIPEYELVRLAAGRPGLEGEVWATTKKELAH